LDAADKSWHVTSPTPYDPPLTYGGWTQSRVLGMRIASLLHARVGKLAEEDDQEKSPQEGSEGGQPSRKRKRKHNVVIHSSPFLRCIQTSIAIGAGIAQYQGEIVEKKRRRGSSAHEDARPSKAKASIAEEEDTKSTAPTEESGEHAEREAIRAALKEPGIEKTTLRVDAFLGEWLSPDYYEEIMPPPESTLMVAGAKADLLRTEQLDLFQPSAPSRGHFPGGWHRVGDSADDSTARPPSPGNGDAFSGLSKLAQALPLRDRSSSHSSAGSTGSRRGHKVSKGVYSSIARSKTVYSAPIPTYAISMSAPIPRGYVAHARDACIDVDLQWDSMREPQSWGDGGGYGEEWSAMHKRFRLGLYRAVSWYKQYSLAEHPHVEEAVCGSSAMEGGDDDCDLILILVTHGAGCNALIGALTNQPVLIDVGMASLTMAVRKVEAEDGLGEIDGALTNITAPLRRNSSVDLGLSKEYELQILASSEHLRSTAETAGLSALQSPKLVPRIPEYGAGQISSNQSMEDGLKSRNNTREATRPVNSALGSIRRSSTMSSSSWRYDSASPSRASNGGSGSGSGSASATGLWSRTPTTPASLDGVSDLSTSPPKEFSLGPSLHGKDNKAVVDKGSDSERDDVAPLQQRSPGLWGGNAPAARAPRQLGPKRRWTVNERET